MGIPLKRVTSFDKRYFKRGNLALGTARRNYASDGDWTNIPSPSEGNYLVVKYPSGASPLVFSCTSTNELFSVASSEGYTGANNLDNILTFFAGENDLMVVGNLDTNTTTVEPFANYQALGNNPSEQEKFFNLDDPADLNSINHGLTEHICMEAGTFSYACIYNNTKIYEVQSDGTVTETVSTGDNPQRGNITGIQGRRYVANKPTSFFGHGRNNRIAPLTLQGTNWGYYYNRYQEPTLYFYTFEDNTDIHIYAGDITDANIISTVSGNEEEVNTFTFPSDYRNQFINIYSTKPIVMTYAGNGGDRGIGALAGEYNYRRRNSYERTIVNTAPSAAGLGGVVYDSSHKSWAMCIADGAGGDSEASLPYEFLTKTFAYGNELKSYYVNSAYTNTVEISYWDSSASEWETFATHTVNGTQTSVATAQSGSQGGETQAMANGALLWKFEGSNPFYVVINDNSRDEEMLLGWNSTYIDAVFA